MNFDLKEKISRKIVCALFLGMFFGTGANAVAADAALSGTVPVYQQETIQVEGVVFDENRIPLAGASVAISDDLTVGTITDVDGKFSMSVPAGTSLVVSFTGYKDAVVVGSTGFMEIQLVPDAQVLEEVVVTALGISRETKSLGYAMQEIETEGLQDNKAVSVANMLQGKIAGVQISQSGAGMGGATRIVLRGLNFERLEPASLGGGRSAYQ